MCCFVRMHGLQFNGPASAYQLTKSGEASICSRFRWFCPLADASCVFASVIYCFVMGSSRTSKLLPPPGMLCNDRGAHLTKGYSVEAALQQELVLLLLTCMQCISCGTL